MTLWQQVKNQPLILRRAFSIALTIGLAVLVGFYFSAFPSFWVTMTAFLVLQIMSPLNLPEALQRFLVILASSFVALLIYFAFGMSVWFLGISIVVFVLGFYLQAFIATRWQYLSPPLLLGMIFLLLLAPFKSDMKLYPLLHDVTLGGLIAVLGNLFILPRRADVDFRTAIVPVLQAYQAYLKASIQLFYAESNAAKQVAEKKLGVEQTLQTQRAMFPDWVYATGFNPLLQQGHRHFLIRIEQLGQILFALHYAASTPIEASLLDNFREPINKCVTQAEDLMTALIARLQLNKLPESVSGDFSDAITALEKTFQETIQTPIELLDLSKDYLTLAAIIMDLKDLQQTLLKLAEALR